MSSYHERSEDVETCPTCRGKGIVSRAGHAARCRRCRGTGMVIAERSER